MAIHRATGGAGGNRADRPRYHRILWNEGVRGSTQQRSNADPCGERQAGLPTSACCAAPATEIHGKEIANTSIKI
jgi:hypothetical protein